jgi:hypothetical protein
MDRAHHTKAGCRSFYDAQHSGGIYALSQIISGSGNSGQPSVTNPSNKYTHKIVLFHPAENYHDRYQRYYYIGFKELLGSSNVTLKPISQLCWRYFWRVIDYRGIIKPDRYISVLLQQYRDYYQRHNTFVSQYILMPQNGKETKFAIDSHDSPKISSLDILDWSDYYFKSNMWHNIEYPSKVLPCVNGNGFISKDDIAYLSTKRNSGKECDIAFISRIWGGREHNIRLFEQISRIDCKKTLLAIFTKVHDKKLSDETVSFKKRLDKCKVEWKETRGIENVYKKKELWDILSQSRLVIVRAGKHLCIPWRMIDLLCLGSCIVYDTEPFPNWPVSIKQNDNFISLNLRRPINGDPAPNEDYEKIPELIENALGNQHLQNSIRKNNEMYFVNHASPHRVAMYVINTIEQLSNNS